MASGLLSENGKVSASGKALLSVHAGSQRKARHAEILSTINRILSKMDRFQLDDGPRLARVEEAVETLKSHH
jgi:hypothetical protein